MARHPITFGVEIEFLAVYPKTEGLLPKLLKTDLGSKWVEGEFDEDEEGVDTLEVILTALKSAGIPVSEDYSNPNSAHPPYTRWNVGVDCNDLSLREVQAFNSDTHCEMSVELSSRVFHLGDPNDDWRREIKAVLDVLREIENLGCRFLTIATSGLHVHVGNGAYKVPLRVSKNVCLLSTAFERVIDELHSANRIAYPVNFYDDFYHAPLSWFHRHNGRLRPDTMLYDWLTNIETAQDYEDLGQVFALLDLSKMPRHFFVKPTYGHNSAYNFENLWKDKNGRPARDDRDLKKTIEFRQHAGTLDFMEIIAWVSFTTSLVCYCSETKPTDILALCARVIDISFDLSDLLSVIGCPADVKDLICRRRAGRVADDDDEEILGFIRAGRPVLPDRTAEYDEIMAVNDEEQSQRMDAVENVWTTLHKDYGFDFGTGQTAILDFPEEAIERYYVEALLEGFQINEGTVDEEDIISDAMCIMFDRLSSIYKGERVEEEAAAAETGSVVTIQSHPEWLPGYEGHMILDDD